MSVTSTDLSFPWGQAPDPLDHQFARWRMAVFQDLQEAHDQSKLYFLYDPVADDNCVTTGNRKGMACIAVFDVHRKCFVAEIPVRVQGRVKMLFALPTTGASGGTSFVVTSQSEDYGQYTLHVWRFELAADGVSAAGDPRSLLNTPLTMDNDEFICSMREDEPELVVLHGPQMQIVRVDATATQPREPVQRFSVPSGELSHYYDAFLSRGSVYFLSATPDGHLDYTRIHIVSLQSQQLTTQYCRPDPQRGQPPARRQAALDSTAGFILLAGGEVDYGGGNVQRLSDYWVLDLTSFSWKQIEAQMSIFLIEPRLTTANSGNVYVWGDFDDPLPGMQQGSTHVRILKVSGLRGFNPPPYAYASGPSPYPSAGGGGGGGCNQPTPSYGFSGPQGGGGPPPYPAAGSTNMAGFVSNPSMGGSGGGGGGGGGYEQPAQNYSPFSGPGGQQPYSSGGGYPNQGGGGYSGQGGGYSGQGGGYPSQGGGGGYPNQGDGQPQVPYYAPDSKKDKKDCNIS